MRGVMKRDNNPDRHSNTSIRNIPDIDIIDLENDDNDLFLDDDPEMSEDTKATTHLTKASEKVPSRRKGIRSLLNVHVLFFLAVIVIGAVIVFRFQNWGVHVDLDEIFKDGQGTYDNTMDSILPLVTSTGQIAESNTENPIIVAFGNAPFADDRDSKDNLCHMIADAADATVYNCSVNGSYLSTQAPNYDSDFFPMDAYSFYWLVTLATGSPIDHYYTEALEKMGESAPPEAPEVYDTLTTLDFNTVDVIVIMYDGSDYLIGRDMYNDEDPTDIQSFTGGLEAGIGLLQDVYPHIRIIVMSPAYAYAIDSNGDYISSDMFTYGQDVFSTYVIREAYSCSIRNVSFVDNLYGTITEDNAKEYLTDNLHINKAGRKLLRDRFVYALEYYSKGYADKEN